MLDWKVGRDWRVGVCVAALLAVPAFGAQEQTPAPTLHINVTAVEIDAVVTDGSGRHVPDLKITDFELLQDGKPEKITSFRFVPARPPMGAATATTTAAAKPIQPTRRATSGAPPPLTSSAQLRRDQARRIMAIVIDDLTIGYNNMSRLRRNLAAWVDANMQPDDAIAFVTTSHGVGRLQQFTSDKAILKETIAGLHINLLGLGASDQENQNAAKITDDTGHRPALDITGAANSAQQNLANDAVQEQLQTGSLAAVQNVVRGMRDLPGRKSVLFVSDGLALLQQSGSNVALARPWLYEAFQRLIDESNRSFVVINTMDTRGVTNPLDTVFSAGNYPQSTPRHQDITNAANAHADTQAGQRELARMAGGLFFTGNDAAQAVDKAMADQEGYYVLGYQPEASTFKRTSKNEVEFHTVKVNVKRPGLQVRNRSGFFGMTDAEAHPAPRSDEERLWNVAASPFVQNDIDVRVTPIFAHRKDGDIFKVLLHLDGSNLTFDKKDDGRYRAPLQILATLIDARGAAVEGKMYTFSLQTAKEPDEAMRQAGFACNVDLPATRPGAYQLRVAVRDVGSTLTGTGYQFVRVPNLTTTKLALSGVALQGDSAGANPSERRFQPSSTLRYAFAAYNAQLDPATHRAALTLRLRLYHDGVLLVDGKPVPIDAVAGGDDPDRSAQVSGELQLSPAIKPGEYQLLLEVTDTRGSGKDSTAQQWIDFTIAGTQ